MTEGTAELSMSPKLLIFGASGLLGANLTAIAVERGLAVVAVSRRSILRIPGTAWDRVDISSPADVENAITRHRPTLTINCAAIADIDLCEARPDLAAAVNIGGARNIAVACARTETRLLHISTDSVFSGNRGDYAELDATGPRNTYARSKKDAELAISEASTDYAILRTNFYGWNAQKKLSLAEWFLQGLRQGLPTPGYADITFSPLPASDVADLILAIGATDLAGLYHLGARDAVTKHEFGRMIAAAFGLDPEAVTPANGLDKTRVARPGNTSMDVSKVSAALGRSMPTVSEGVSRFRESDTNGYRARIQASVAAGVRG